MLQLFQKGGPVMWPLLTASLIATTLVIERIIFMTRARFRENPALRRKIFFLVESGDIEQAKAVAEKSQDPVVRMMLDGLRNKEHLQTALMTSASAELKKYSRGITVLDTIITLAPLLGLLGTVTG